MILEKLFGGSHVVMSEDIAETIRRYLHYCFKDIDMKYSKLIPVEKEIITASDYEEIVDWIMRKGTTTIAEEIERASIVRLGAHVRIVGPGENECFDETDIGLTGKVVAICCDDHGALPDDPYVRVQFDDWKSANRRQGMYWLGELELANER